MSWILCVLGVERRVSAQSPNMSNHPQKSESWRFKFERLMIWVNFCSVGFENRRGLRILACRLWGSVALKISMSRLAVDSG